MGGGLPACCCLWHRWCSGRRRARPPARLGDLTSFGAAPRSPPVPSGPSGALHTSGACVAYGCPTTRQHCGRLGPSRSNFARNSPAITSNVESAPLELQRFRMVFKNDRGKLCAKFVWAKPRHRPRHRSQAPPRSPAKPSGSSGALHDCGPGRGMVLSSDCISVISHAIPLSVFQVLKSNR